MKSCFLLPHPLCSQNMISISFRPFIKALLTYIACFCVHVHNLGCVFVVCYYCRYSFHCLEPAGSVPDGFSCSWRLTFMLPAQADTLRACALSRFTDVKPGSNCNNKTGSTNMFWWVVVFFLAVWMYTSSKHGIYRSEFLVVSLSARVVVYRQSCLVKICFLFTVRECRERVSPFQSQLKGSRPARWVLQCPHCEWALFFSTANN